MYINHPFKMMSPVEPSVKLIILQHDCKHGSFTFVMNNKFEVIMPIQGEISGDTVTLLQSLGYDISWVRAVSEEYLTPETIALSNGIFGKDLNGTIILDSVADALVESTFNFSTEQ